MPRVFSLLSMLVLLGCAGPDSDPIEVAERFHQLRQAGDMPGIHDLLTDADRAAVPLEAFMAALPAGAARELVGSPDTRPASAVLLSNRGDTAAVVLQATGGGHDTLRLVVTQAPIRLWRYERQRARWRVSMRLAERATLDSLAALVRAETRTSDREGVERAEAYLRAAEQYPCLARSADVAAAGAVVRAAAIVDALRIEFHLTESLQGVPFLEGRVLNPTGARVATLRLVLRDAAGAEEQIELWNIGAGESTPLRQLTRLRTGPVTHRVERIQLF